MNTHLTDRPENRFVTPDPGGTVALTAPSTAHQISLDLRDAPMPGFVMEPPGFLLHIAAPAAPVVSHLVPIGAFDGPYGF